MATFTSFDAQFEGTGTPSRYTRRHIRIRIPKDYQQEPIISDLITKHGVTVNIEGALLGAGVREDGWFDLDLQGSVTAINGALGYLNDLNIEILNATESDDSF